MKRLLIFPVMVLSLTGCALNDQDSKTKGAINISEVHMPNNGQVNQIIEVELEAEAPNGCWSELEITLTGIDDRHFLFKATGLIDTNDGICPQMLVHQDTIINFIPLLTGEYYFQTNESPFVIVRDTVDVN